MLFLIPSIAFERTTFLSNISYCRCTLVRWHFYDCFRSFPVSMYSMRNECTVVLPLYIMCYRFEETLLDAVMVGLCFLKRSWMFIARDVLFSRIGTQYIPSFFWVRRLFVILRNVYVWCRHLKSNLLSLLRRTACIKEFSGIFYIASFLYFRPYFSSKIFSSVLYCLSVCLHCYCNFPVKKVV